MNPVQAKLDICERSRTSLLPWRGQFSPELIEHVIEAFCPNAATIGDPFCGSGTVLAEAMRRGLDTFGIDVNPAAYVLSSFSHLIRLSPHRKAALSSDAARLMAPFVAVDEDDLFRRGGQPHSIADIVGRADDAELRLLLHISALIGCGDSKDLSTWKLARGVQSVQRTLNRLNTDAGKLELVLGDARHELKGFSCDAIITSPPYINVFNYHQNYRPIMEHLGWSPLSCAVGEIGANRKHRQNRFLTVIQYCIDMALLMRSARQALSDNGVFVIVLGRESNVLKTAFFNGSLIRSVVNASGMFSVASEHERVFTNRFGARIYEDIFVLRPNQSEGHDEAGAVIDARNIGRDALEASLGRAPEGSRSAIEGAIAAAQSVNASPRPALKTPPLWPAMGAPS